MTFISPISPRFGAVSGNNSDSKMDADYLRQEHAQLVQDFEAAGFDIALSGGITGGADFNQHTGVNIMTRGSEQKSVLNKPYLHTGKLVELLQAFLAERQQ